ncbi:MAG: hypothetical protein OXF65_13985 [Acidimicrobiaceae bacterium]|nr:hypothetical protein [Acidimicrobiaceae bacterium]
MSTDTETMRQAGSLTGLFKSFLNVSTGAAAGLALLLLGVPVWLLPVLAACYLVASFGRFRRRQRRQAAAAAEAR